MVTYWVGTVSVSGDAEISVEMQQQIQAMLEPHNCIPVFIPKKLVDDHYLGYCKQVTNVYNILELLLFSHPA
jgi:trehalose-6-phosphate synthase